MTEQKVTANSGTRMLMSAAENGKGVSLTPSACRQVANTLVEQSRAGQELLNILMPTDNMLKAYVNEYGDELLNELLEDGGVVEGELVNDEETEETGLAGENDGLDSSEEE